MKTKIDCQKAYDLIMNILDEECIEVDELQKIVNILYPGEFKVYEEEE